MPAMVDTTHPQGVVSARAGSRAAQRTEGACGSYSCFWSLCCKNPPSKNVLSCILGCLTFTVFLKSLRCQWARGCSQDFAATALRLMRSWKDFSFIRWMTCMLKKFEDIASAQIETHKPTFVNLIISFSQASTYTWQNFLSHKTQYHSARYSSHWAQLTIHRPLNWLWITHTVCNLNEQI